MGIEQIQKSHNAPAPYLEMHHSEQKRAVWCEIGLVNTMLRVE